MTMRLKSLDDLKGMTARVADTGLPARTMPIPAAAPPAAPVSAKARMQALGRMADGEMNKTEARFAEHLEQQKLAKAVQWYAFEKIKLKLAKNTTLTVDFAVLRADSVIEMIDVKGAKAIFEDDARAKIKVAAAMFPFVFKAVYPRAAKDGGGWEVEVF